MSQQVRASTSPILTHLLLLFAACAALTAAPLQTCSAAPIVKGASAILVDARTGQILWAKNPHVRRPMASTTKVMTMLLALEHGNLDGIVTAPRGVQNIPETSFHLVPGEKLPLVDLLYACVIRSANDAAVAIADYIGGNEKTFVGMMNARARELGMKDTHYVNANGLNASGHYSSAYDLAKLARYIITIPEFDKLCATREILVPRTESKDRLLRTPVRFLWHYPGADGIKSGYTHQAGHCYIGSATRNGWRLISVVLKSPNAGADTQAMLNYGFGRFVRLKQTAPGASMAQVKLKNAHPAKLELITKSDLDVDVLRGDRPDQPRTQIARLSVPVRKGETVGQVTAYVNGRPVTKVALVAASAIAAADGRPKHEVGWLGAFLGVSLCYVVFRLRVRPPARRAFSHPEPFDRNLSVPPDDLSDRMR